MSNASGPLLSLGDSLDSLRQRMFSADPQKIRVLRNEIAAYSLASSLSDDVDYDTVREIVETTSHVATLDPSNDELFEQVMTRVENLLRNLGSE